MNKCLNCKKIVKTKFCPDCGIEIKEILTKPDPIINVDVIKLRGLCQDYINAVESENFCDDTGSDYCHYIFEEAIMTFFGRDVFNSYINKRLQS
jgi:hypothetical protein